MALTPELAGGMLSGCIVADWPAPPGIVALTTTRPGGLSAAPYDSLNLAAHVGDRPEKVAANRAQLQSALGLADPVAWLDQVHGVGVVRAGPDAAGVAADAAWTDATGTACAVLTADCLPVFLCSFDGSCVAAAHAGWRGLAGGVLEAVISAMPVPGDQLLAWLGPAIGPAAFEVGAEVLSAFADPAPADKDSVRRCFSPSPGRQGHYLADLYALARLRLAGAGVSRVYGGGACTFSDPERFYSFRRDGETGRMGSVIFRQTAP